jgi:hypothetical protein
MDGARLQANDLGPSPGGREILASVRALQATPPPRVLLQPALC